jgi:hypothetical protein
MSKQDSDMSVLNHYQNDKPFSFDESSALCKSPHDKQEQSMPSQLYGQKD